MTSFLLMITTAVAMLSPIAMGREIFYERQLELGDADYNDLLENLPHIISNHPAGILKNSNSSVPMLLLPKNPYNGSIPSNDRQRIGNATQQAPQYDPSYVAPISSIDVSTSAVASNKRRPETTYSPETTSESRPRKLKGVSKTTTEATTEADDGYETITTKARRTGYRKLRKTTTTTVTPDEYEDCECECEEEEDTTTKPPKRTYKYYRKTTTPTTMIRPYRRTTTTQTIKEIPESNCICDTQE